MSDLGEPKKYLGINITRDLKNKILRLDQRDYIDKILERFEMSNSKPVPTPMKTNGETNKELKTIEESPENSEQRKMLEITKFPFRELIGSLRYLTDATRPDLAYAVHVLSTKLQEPTNFDWIRAKRILRYLNGTKDLGLVYKSEKDNVEVYSDASYRDVKPSNKTTEGFIIKLFGDVISWTARRRKQRVASTCEAEFRALNEAVREMKCIQGTIHSVMGKFLYPVSAYCDNQSVIFCTLAGGKSKLKYVVEPEEQITRECVKYNEVEMNWVDSTSQLADIFTKPLDKRDFQRILDQLLA